MEYQLRERVVLIAGALTSTTQALMASLTNEGADVALLDSAAERAEKFCAQLMDQREIKAKHGRAIAIKCNLAKPSEIKESVGRIVQALGGVDIFIDAQISNESSPINIDQQVDETTLTMLDQLLEKNLKSTLLITQTVVGYLKSRKKGRIIYLLNDCTLKTLPMDMYQNATRSGLVFYAQSLAKQLQEHNVTVNVLSLGLTEEYLLGHYPNTNIKDALQMHKVYDHFARITEPDKIANAVVFLGGPSGMAMSGQVIRLN